MTNKKCRDYRIEYRERGTGSLLCLMEHVPYEDAKTIMGYYSNPALYPFKDVPLAFQNCCVYVRHEHAYDDDLED